MRSVALSVVLVVLLAVGATPLVAAGVSETPTDGPADSTLAVGAIEPTAESGPLSSLRTTGHDAPTTTFTINLQSDQDAEWVVTVEYELETSAQQTAFRSVAEEFEAGDEPAATPAGVRIDLYENLAALASERTDREMAITNVDRSGELQGTTGTLELSFTWSEFLEADGDRLVFNDALGAPNDGTWLRSLDEHQELRITTPRGYAITSANVGFTDNTVVIEGPYRFDADDHVRIILEPSTFAGVSWELLGAAVVVAGGIIGGALLLGRREPDDAAATATNGGIDASSSSQSATDSTQSPPEPTPGGDAEPDESKPTEDLSLLADDEQVLQLLERNSGRMRQADIVTETDWSDAKVSQLLSSMADDDQITKLRIGRENLISLPDVDALDGSKRDDETER